jgi:predicted enzyme related to lactoylglutathione lyase
MPTRDTAPVGAPCWVDLMSSDTNRSRDFYTQLLGWTAEAPNAEFGGYFNFQKDGVREAGCMASQPGEGPSDVWSVYLATDDAAKTVEVATAKGAQVIAPAMAVGDLGTMAVFLDPTGAAVGVWQPNQFGGFGAYGEPGTPGWFELSTRDYDKAVDFYREVFGLEVQVVSDTADFRYSTLNIGEEQVAGIMDATSMLPPGAPPHWSVYFAVDDADAALARTTDLGGKVIRPAEDTPYGRLATAQDANGAIFLLVAPNDQMPART